MKRKATYILSSILLCFYAGFLIVPVMGQVPGSFFHWPALYDAAQHTVVIRGTNATGAENDLLYVRIGWGECLGIRKGEFRDFWYATESDRYINLRTYASTQFEDPSGWNAEHQANCPNQPKEVKPYWTGSRPTYVYLFDEELQLWVKGNRTDYRIVATGDSPSPCTEYRAWNATGTKLTSYFQLPFDVEVFDSDKVNHLVGDLEKRLVTVCRKQDISVEDWRRGQS